MKKFVFLVISLVASCVAFSSEVDSLASCSFVESNSPKKDPCLLKGKVKIVNDYPDITIKIVKDYPDIEVTVVDEYVGHECGRIMLVNDYPDIKVKIVEDYPDITIRFKDEKSKDLFIKQLANPK